MKANINKTLLFLIIGIVVLILFLILLWAILFQPTQVHEGETLASKNAEVHKPRSKTKTERVDVKRPRLIRSVDTEQPINTRNKNTVSSSFINNTDGGYDDDNIDINDQYSEISNTVVDNKIIDNNETIDNNDDITYTRNYLKYQWGDYTLKP